MKENRLREMRDSDGLSLREMSELCGLSNPYLSQLETGRITNPGISALDSLARHYKLTHSEMMQAFGYEPVALREQP